MKTYLLHQLILVCSLMAYKSYCLTETGILSSEESEEYIIDERKDLQLEEELEEENATSIVTSTLPAVTESPGTTPYFESEEYNERDLNETAAFHLYTIVGRPRDYPYHVAITYKSDDFVLCQGALVAPDWMLTSASCFAQYSVYVADNLRVVAGTVSTRDRNAITSDIEYEVNHPQFDPLTEVNDLTLLKLHTSMYDTNGLVKPIQLSRNEYPVGTVCNYSTYDEFRLFGLNLKLKDLSTCNFIPNEVGETLNYVCVSYDDLQFLSIHDEDDSVAFLGTPLVCNNQLYGMKTKEGFFYEMYNNIPWVNTVMKEDHKETSDEITTESTFPQPTIATLDEEILNVLP